MFLLCLAPTQAVLFQITPKQEHKRRKTIDNQIYEYMKCRSFLPNQSSPFDSSSDMKYVALHDLDSSSVVKYHHSLPHGTERSVLVPLAFRQFFIKVLKVNGDIWWTFLIPWSGQKNAIRGERVHGGITKLLYKRKVRYFNPFVLKFEEKIFYFTQGRPDI